MRTVVLDTETTGLSPDTGHRIVEIGCIELMHLVPTGRVYHQYINPQRDMPAEAFRIHGLSSDFLRSYPSFRDIYQPFLDFIEESPLVIHNARFDMKFLNHELKTLGQPVLAYDRAIDTLMIAKQLFPGSPANLDALCRRFEIDNTRRTHHGALLDAELLAEVYLELMGGRQQDLTFGEASGKESLQAVDIQRQVRPQRACGAVSAQENQAHEVFLTKLVNPLWSYGTKVS